MITLNINESKSISFEVSVQGVELNDLKGALRIVSEGIEYGFPISISNGSISVNIPSLGRLIKGRLNDSIEAKLEIIAGDTYIVPWTDTIKIESPVVVEAKVKEIKEVKKLLSIDVRKIEEKVIKEPKVIEVKPKTKFGQLLGK
ncbi:hypothetical protein KKF82_06300 [Patescibacteria group bacterium]|nr:hypothetical protein [Patescibacteria group bacterium]